MKHRRRLIAVAALATTLAAWPMAAAAQEIPAATDDPLIVIGWQDDQGGAIYGHASDLQALLTKQREAQVQAQIADNPNLMAGAVEGCPG